MTTTPAAKNNTAQIELERTPPPCDRCRGTSLTVVELITNRTLRLSFCGHHFKVNEALLVLAGWVLVADTRAQLAVREATRQNGGVR